MASRSITQLPLIATAREDAAQDAWESAMPSVRDDVIRSLNRQFKSGGTATLRRRLNYLRSKNRLSQKELAELHMLPEALVRAAKSSQERSHD